jgi:ATP-dependent Clp protease ATP-binding subunit ClpX
VEASQEYNCNFCGLTKHEVKYLIGGQTSSYICNNCVQKCHALLADKLHQKTEESVEADGVEEEVVAVESDKPQMPTPTVIKSFLDQYVVGQEDAKVTVAVAAYNHYKRISNPAPEGVEIDKSNILLLGPTGSGKTLIATSLARCLHVPYAMADATALTEAGYVGEDVESIVGRLLANANYNVEMAERGIIFLDEIDKKRSAKSASGGRDVSGESVQQALLKILEGTEVMVSPPGKKNADRVKVNTKNILFIVSGAFVGLDKIMAEKQRQIGFSAGAMVSSHQGTTMAEHLVKFGLIPEMVGRLPVVAMLKELDEGQLFHVLTEPKNAITKQFKALFEQDDVELEFTDEALRALARKAIANKTGARGLRGLIEEALLMTQYNLPDMRIGGVSSVIVSEDVFLNGKEPHVRFGKG